MEALKNFLNRYLIDIKISRDLIFKVLALVFLYILALLMRLYPFLVNEAYIRAYDPYVQYYAAQYIEQHGVLSYISSFSTKFWYPWGAFLGERLYPLIPIAGALFHKLLLTLGFNIDLFTAVAIMPAFFGSLTIFPVYGIAKEVRNDRAGLFAAFFAAMSPGLLQRTVVGFYDNESVGILLVLLAIYFFLKSERSEKNINYAVLAGFALGLLTINWGSYRYVYGILAVYVVLVTLIGKADEETITSYVITIFLALAIGSLAPRNGNLLTSSDMFLALAVSVFAIIFQVLYLLYGRLGEKGKEQLVKLSIIIIAALSFLVAILFSLRAISPIADKFIRVMNPLLRDISPAFSSVSENQPASWGTIFLGIYIPIIFVPIGVYYFIEDRSKTSIFMLLVTLSVIYFAASISRFIVVAAPLAVVTAAIGVDYLLEPFARILRGEWFVHHIKPIRRALGEQRLPKGEAVVVYGLIALLVLSSVNHAVWATQGFVSYDVASYEKEAFNYLKEYAKPTDVVLSWWDYGYRLTVIGNVTTLADGATSNSTQMGVIGAMFMLPPEKSVLLMKKYNVKYVVVYSIDILKAIWMIRIAEKYAPGLGVKESAYYSAQDGGYKEPFFHSTLWTLLAFQDEQRAKFWVSNFAVKDLRDSYDKFRVTNLRYFKLVLNTRLDGTQQNLKIYKVIYRSDTPFYNTVPMNTKGDLNVAKTASYQETPIKQYYFSKMANLERIRISEKINYGNLLLDRTY